jgi:hypothetical protein
MPSGTRDQFGDSVTIDWIHHLTHQGKMHRVAHIYTGVSASTGCNFVIDIPAGTTLHWNASYFSKFGGILEATYAPTITNIGTEIAPRNNRTKLATNIKTKFYHTATATAGVGDVYPIGIPGGTAVAGNGASGGTEQRSELDLKPGQWLVIIKPFADSAVVIINATIYEEDD